MERLFEKTQEVTGIILAGGFSKRFGTEKWKVMLNGSSMIDRVAASLSEICGELKIVCRREQPVRCQYSAELVHDDPALAPGPLRGMIAGLKACATQLALVTACDTPCIRPELVRLLVEYGRECFSTASIGVVPQWHGKRQPLVALYFRHASEPFEKMLAKGIQSVNESLDLLPHDTFSQESCRRADPQGISFVNINCIDDLAQLSSMMDRSENQA